MFSDRHDNSTRRPPEARRIARGPGRMELWRLFNGAAVAEVIPARGGLVTRFAVDGDEVLYLDGPSLIDRSKNVRGGIPVLFPIAGRLKEDRYSLGGDSYPMRQHGLARQAAWSVVDVAGARIIIEFRSNPATMSTFPFRFCLRMTVDLGRAGGRTLALEQEVENLGDKPLPVHLGLHPYFAVPDDQKGRVKIDLAATRAFDNVTGEEKPYAGFDLQSSELDLHLLDPKQSETVLTLPDKAPRHLSWSPLFKVVVLWTLRYKDYVCVEPWTAPGNALNSGEGLLQVAPGEKISGWFLISV